MRAPTRTIVQRVWTLHPGPWTPDLDPGPQAWTLDPGPWTSDLDPGPKLSLDHRTNCTMGAEDRNHLTDDESIVVVLVAPLGSQHYQRHQHHQRHKRHERHQRHH